MTLDEIQEGMSVFYIPRHAQGKRTHPDCQRGMVTGKTATNALVRYGTDQYSTPPHPPSWCQTRQGHEASGGVFPRQTAAVGQGAPPSGTSERRRSLGDGPRSRRHEIAWLPAHDVR